MASRTRTSQPDFSLIVAEGDGRMLTVGDHATLAVFSGDGEAELFLHFAVENGGWKVQKTSPAKLVSMLDRTRGTERVALDPSPEMFAERLVGLVSMGKDRFIAAICRARAGLEATCGFLDCSRDESRSPGTSVPDGMPTVREVTVADTNA